MKFDGYGKLEWLEPKQYYVESWQFVEVAVGEDGERYDIVVKRNPCKIAYTNI